MQDWFIFCNFAPSIKFFTIMKKKFILFAIIPFFCVFGMTARADGSKLDALCDEWNVLHTPFSDFSPYSTIIYSLTTDTIIGENIYIKLVASEQLSSSYQGALREDDHSIYYIPKGSTHEYLLYAFNAKEGDQLVNLWIGGREEDNVGGHKGTVITITENQPHRFVLEISIEDENEVIPYQVSWIEGIGYESTPTGNMCPPSCAADYGVFDLLCAYKNAEQVYSSTKAESFGCYYDGYYQALEAISETSPSSAIKILHNGQIYILRGDRTYTLQGIEIKE